LESANPAKNKFALPDKIMEKLDNAELLLRQGNYQEAIQLYEEVHQAYPEEESVLLMLAWAHYDSGAAAKAISYLEILLQQELQRKVWTGFAFDELVRIYKQEKNFPKLVEICTRAVTAQPDDTGLLIELGNAYLQAGEAKDACRIFEKIVHLENDNPTFYCLLGEALFAAGQTGKSEESYLHAAAIDPEQVDRYYFQIADLFAKNGRYEDAQRLLKKCVEANPASPVYHCCLGDALVGLGQIQEALSEYKAAAHEDRAGAGAYYNRFGNTLARAKHYREAVQIFRIALEIEPDNSVYARHLTLSYEALKSLSEKAKTANDDNKHGGNSF